MGCSQFFRRGERHVVALYLSHGALVLNKRSRRGLDAGGLSSMAVKKRRNDWGETCVSRSELPEWRGEKAIYVDERPVYQ